ncbi:MAG TPA: GAF domain-containing SpoIIE family protein phosphatase [Candidatus Acidoferrales bacterium]|nr:GAF domain-containing SpoIIE family protein phosphatase [Candidatus Acidoferrales bacterium]
MDDLPKLGGSGVVADPVPSALLAALPEHTRALGLLYDVSRELTSILDLEELLRRIARRVKPLVDYHAFTVTLWNESSQLLEPVFALKYEDSIPLRTRLGLHQGLTGTAAAERRVIRVGDVREDPRFVGCEHGVDVRSELVVPLLLQERLIGVLDLESTKLHAFTAEDERMLEALGSYIAVALENARLFEQVRENERRLQHDLDTAREIQLGLLPAGAREVPGLDLGAGYAPARELGGDFYDFLPSGGGRLALALGDVSGKGTAAALFGSLAIGALREHAVDHRCRPAEVLTTLNQRLHSRRLEGRFIAMAFALYDAHSRTLTVANAGAPRPVLIRDGSIEIVRVEGVPLGLFPEAEYEEASLELRPGDVVVIASDGIHEAQNRNKEEFGVERLAAVVSGLARESSARAIAEQVLCATDEHSAGGLELHDDRTILVLRITHEPVAGDDWSKFPIIY